MKTVLIVEDEILARMGLRQLIDWTAEGFCLLPEAKDGKEAIETIKSERPDIILLDLNIPVVNGLQILQYLKKQQIPSRTIVITCNEEFDVVKQAMKLGAYDYLRKLNLSSEELLSAIRKCQTVPEQKRATALSGDREQNVRNNLYYEDILSEEKSLFDGMKTYGTTMCIISKEPVSEKDYLMENLIRKWLTDRELSYIHIIKNGQRGGYLLEKTIGYDDAAELHEILNDQFKGDIYMGICQIPINNVNDFMNSFSLSDQISLKVYYDEDEQIKLFHEKIPVKGYSPRGIQSIISKLKNHIEGFEIEEAKRSIENIFSVIRNEKYMHINVIRRNFMDILGIFSMAARNIGREIEEIELRGSNCHYQNLMSMNSLNEIENWFFEFEEKFFWQFRVDFKCCNSEILKHIIDYIEEHIKEKVALKDAAKKIGISAAYLSTVFKKEMGQNLTEYINIRKVQMAKEMLLLGRLVYEVSEQVGFENVTYFSKVFKKYTGVSPDIFRKNHNISGE